MATVKEKRVITKVITHLEKLASNLSSLVVFCELL